MPNYPRGLSGLAKFTAYTPGQGNRRMEGGYETATGAPMYTLEQFMRGKAPYVTGAMAGRPTGRRIWTRLPGMGTIPIGLTDTGGGLRRNQIDIASSNRSYATNFPYQGQYPIYHSNPMSRIPPSGDVYGDYGGFRDTPGEPQVYTSQNIPPNESNQLPINTWYSNEVPSTGGAGEFYGGVYPRPPLPYPAPDMNIPTNEEVMPTPVNTFYGSTSYNNTPRRYPGLSGVASGDWRQNAMGLNYPGYVPPVARAVAANPNFYPVPGLGGGPPSGDWRQNATWQGYSRPSSEGNIRGGSGGFFGSISSSSFPMWEGFGSAGGGGGPVVKYL